MSSPKASRSTGFTDTQLGMILFVAAEFMFFGALASSYVFLRTAADSPWPQGREVLSSTMATATIILLMGLAFAIAEARRRAADGASRGHAVRWLMVGACAGVAAFLVVAFEFWRMQARGHTPSTNNLFAIYVLCTGMIAVRALAVAGYAGFAALRLPRDKPSPDRVEGLAYYAQFLVVLSMLQFLLFYLV